MATVDDLSVRIAADTADFQSGAEMVESQLGDLSSEAIQTAASLEILSNRADDAGDNVSQAGRRATIASGQFSALSSATSAANASFMGISATTWGSLIPAVVALGAALAPVIGALGGFVAVAGSIAAVGLLPTIGAIATETEVLREQFNAVVSTIKDAFAPVFYEAANVLVILMMELRTVIDEMVPAQDVIQNIAGNFAQLGVELINALPAFVDLAVALTQEFLPPFVTFVQNVLPDVPGMIRGFVDVFDRMLPRFMEAGRLLGEILPPFTEFGFTVLEVLGPALAWMAEQGTAALEFINSLSAGTQKAVAAVSLLAPVITVLGSLFGGALLSALGTVASVLTGPLVSALGTVAALLGPAGIVAVAVAAAIGLFVMFEDEIRAAVGVIAPLISDAFNSAAAWLQSTGAKLLRQGMTALGSVVRASAIEIYNMIAKPGQSVIFQALKDVGNWLVANGPGILATAWDTLVELGLAAWRGFKQGLIGNSVIPDTFQAVKNFLTGTAAAMLASGFAKLLIVGQTWANEFKNMFIDVWNFLIGGFGRAFNSILGQIEQGINGIIGLINDAIATIPWDLVPGMDAPDQLAEVDVPELSPDAGQFERAQTDRGKIREQVVERIATITVEDGEIVAKMDDRAQSVVDGERRATRRTQGRDPTPR